ncbi:HlyD family efflux transporter periplasmic adaptor subunit [Acinetobacter sp. WCHAc060025]|uniref:HlyD family secretion protein n=1 Tax=Acinetobacter sp. WCHAc060025 TaxID=2518625 RepID=UPI001023BD36|nr:HlyD family efflux transporter periplasmic adaptor subunit [Acinetobacter sp. WCHAc060025]RZG77130.1 HlyD family efflux transporter periplasmic adaptor subunit [Acinetobacter sp. WCHAc060025]
MTDAPTTNASPNDELEAQADLQAKQKRKKMLKIFAFIVITIAILYAIWALVFGNIVETDNAYVGAETAAVTSMVSGQVEKVLVSDTQQVKKGDVLAIIDNRDAKIALAQAEAQLAKAKRQYTQSSANSSSLSSQILISSDDINSAKAQVAQAEVAYTQAQQEFARRQQLNATGAISKEEFSKAQSALDNAKASVNVAKAVLAQTESKRKAAQSNLDANEALIRGTSQSSTPDVLAAQAVVDQALLDLQRTEIKAPLDGVIAGRSIQIGQRVAAGSSLMKIVPISELYVDANFKESQLKDVKVGQKATLTSDLYGKKVEYHGTVIGFSGGTGSAFALIPAQNATGNWIKVVQRLPVRIKLDPKELAEHPLRVGLSMNAEVDTSTAK